MILYSLLRKGGPEMMLRKTLIKQTCIALIVLLSLASFAACDKTDNSKDTSVSSVRSEETTPTGLSEGMISPPQIMYKGVIYKYRFSGKRTGLLDDFKEVGTVLAVNDYEIPGQDFHAGGREMHFAQGQKVFASEADQTKISVYCDDGYYMFYSGEE